MVNVGRRGLVLLIRKQLQVVLVLMTASLLGLWTKPAQAEYRLNAGDVLEISVIGIPALHTRAPIDLDGNIAFPLVGQIKAAGSSIDELAERITKLLANRDTGSSSSEPRLNRITSQEINIQVAEYCPVYLNGAVARPGAQPFRPGLTARQAISLAGGVGTNSQAGANLADNGLWIDYARELSRIWRLQAERSYLDKGTQLNAPPTSDGQLSPDLVSTLKSAMEGIPLSKSVLTQVTAAETDQLLLTRVAYTKEHDYLAKAIGEVDEQLAILLKQQANEQSESDQDAQEFDQVRALYSAKLTTLDKVSGVRHQTLSVSTQLLQTTSLIAQTQRERDTLDDRLRQIESDRRIAIANELEETNINLAKTRASLQALGELVGEAQSGSRLTISIVRKTDGVSSSVVGTEDTALWPGDVVQVSITGAAATLETKRKIAGAYSEQ